MLGFGGLGELVFIFFLAMLIFGPEKLPEMGRLLAKGLAEVRKASNELKRTLNAELAVSEQEAEARRRASLPPPPPFPAAPLPLPDAPPLPLPPSPTVPVLSTEPPLFPPLEHAQVAAEPVEPAEPDAGSPLQPPQTSETPEATAAAAPVLRPAAMTVPAAPPGAPADAPLAPYGEGRTTPTAAPEQADADVN